jgi:hypothetical protein
MIPKTRLTNRKPIEDFKPAGDFILVFEPPFERESCILVPCQRTQCAERKEGWERSIVYGEVVAFGDKCTINKTEGIKVGDLIGYPRTNSGTGNLRHRLGANYNIPREHSRKDCWQEDDKAVLSCCLLIKEIDVQGIIR